MQIPATVITQVSGSLVSDDGQQMALKLLQPDGTDLVLAIPRDEILNLVDVAAHARSQSDKILKVDPKTSVGHRVIWWDLAIDDTTNQVVLTLTFGAGGKLAFLFGKDGAQRMLEALQVCLGSTTPPVPTGPRH